jgi:CRP/FNR family transcriptional regulator, cyclic AMP receptor protein
VEWQLLGAVPGEELRRLLSIARRRTFARGEVVFHAGDPADSLHLVAKGRFAARIVTPLGDVAMVGIHGAGAAFGELALLEGNGTRSATVSALEAGETHAVYRTDFERTRREFPGVNAVLVALLAQEVRRLTAHLVEAYYVDAERRVLRRLLEVVSLYATGGGTAVVPLRQEDIASLAGTSRATVNRVLRDEERRGTLELARGKTVVDVAALERRVR